jgi:hypothetical protein
MEIRLKPGSPHFKRHLRGRIDLWFVAAIIGLIGTWLSGTTIEHPNDGWMSHNLSVAVTPISIIVTLLWVAIAVWWYQERTVRTAAYVRASRGNPDFLTLDDFGVTWGVQDVATTKVAWTAVGYYRLTKETLELGLPAYSLEVQVGELEGAGINDLEPLLQKKVGKAAE